MRHDLLALAAALGLAALTATAVRAQQNVIIHPAPAPSQSGTETHFRPLNNPNYLDYGPLPNNPGADKSQDYMNQAGGNDPAFSGPGSDVDSDIMPDNDGAYDGP
ncbi:MAG TPA: hypothetical protein VLA00_04525 [Xanthobacteraceae bacterium]|nr:hypothetical protein [Xanthobacteraceae bacterium]